MKIKSVKFNFLMNIILTLSSFIFPLITFPYISRVLSPIGIGKVNFAVSFISYFIMLAQLGIPTYGIRVCAQSRDNKDELSKKTQELLIINIFMSVISYFILFLLLMIVPKLKEDRILYIVTSFNILLSNLGVEWLFKGLEQYSYITVRSIAFKIISLLAMFMLVHEQSDYVIYAGILVFASVASNIMNFVYSKKFVYYKRYHNYELKRHIKPISIFFAMTCATTIYTNLDTVMLKFLKSDAEVGIYTASTKIKLILATIVSSLGAVLLPRVSYYIKSNMKEEFHNITGKAINFVFVISVPLMMYSILFSKECILFIAGKEYVGSILPMKIMLPTIVFIGLTNILGIQILVPLGKEKIVLYSEIVGAIVDFALNFILIPKYASVGAAIGTLIAEFSVLIFQYVSLKSEIKDVFLKIRYYKIIFAVGISSLLSILVLKFNCSVFISLLLSSVIFFLVYGIILIIFKETMAIYIFSQIKNKLLKKQKSSEVVK